MRNAVQLSMFLRITVVCVCTCAQSERHISSFCSLEGSEGSHRMVWVSESSAYILIART